MFAPVRYFSDLACELLVHHDAFEECIHQLSIIVLHT